MHSALDALAKVPLSERWSHPQMLEIRTLGPRALPDLRRVLVEKDSSRTQLLLLLGSKCPRATNYISDFPNPAKLSERRWAACQALQNIGAAARPALPARAPIFQRGDVR